MGNEFKDFEMETPSLTLEPDLGEFEKKEEVLPKKQTQKEEVPVLTPEEQKMVNDFAAKIDIENTNQILQYGAGTQKKMADFSDTALENVKTQDLGCSVSSDAVKSVSFSTVSAGLLPSAVIDHTISLSFSANSSRTSITSLNFPSSQILL